MLVFQGGVARGIVHVGALRAVEDLSVHRSIKAVAGTSAGAIIAALVAAGYTSRDMVDPDTGRSPMLDELSDHMEALGGSRYRSPADILGQRAWRLIRLIRKAGALATAWLCLPLIVLAWFTAYPDGASASANVATAWPCLWLQVALVLGLFALAMACAAYAIAQAQSLGATVIGSVGMGVSLALAFNGIHWEPDHQQFGMAALIALMFVYLFATAILAEAYGGAVDRPANRLSGHLVVFTVSVAALLALWSVTGFGPATTLAVALVLCGLVVIHVIRRLASGLTTASETIANINRGIALKLAKNAAEHRGTSVKPGSVDLETPITFEKLARTPGTAPLKLVATQKDNAQAFVFSRETTPHVAVAEAVMASAGIPGIFRAVPIRFKDGEKHFVDGGMVSNLPVWVLDRERNDDPDAGTIAFTIKDVSSRPMPLPDSVTALVRLMWQAIFGSPQLEVRAAGPRFELVSLPTSYERLGFDITAKTAHALVQQMATRTRNGLESRLVVGPELFEDGVLIFADTFAKTFLKSRIKPTHFMRVHLARRETDNTPPLILRTVVVKFRWSNQRYIAELAPDSGLVREIGLGLPFSGTLANWMIDPQDVWFAQKANNDGPLIDHGNRHIIGRFHHRHKDRYRKEVIWPDARWTMSFTGAGMRSGLVRLKDDKDGHPVKIRIGEVYRRDPEFARRVQSSGFMIDSDIDPAAIEAFSSPERFEMRKIWATIAFTSMFYPLMALYDANMEDKDRQPRDGST